MKSAENRFDPFVGAQPFRSRKAFLLHTNIKNRRGVALREWHGLLVAERLLVRTGRANKPDT